MGLCDCSELHGRSSISERLQLRDTGIRTIYEPASIYRVQPDMRRHYIRDIRKIESIESLLKMALRIIDINRAAAGSRTGDRLRDEKQLMQGIVLDVRAAEDLLRARSGQ